MITERDLQVIEFIEKYKVASTSTLEHFFYPSKRVAQRRLLEICEKKYLKRDRDFNFQDFYYFIEKPKHLRHSLLITEFYKEFSKYVEIENFIVQKKIENIIPDATIIYNYNNKKKIAMLEIEISNNGFDYDKYHNFPFKKYDNTFKNVFIVTKQRIKQDNNINFIQIRDISKDLEQIFNKTRNVAI